MLRKISLFMVAILLCLSIPTTSVYAEKIHTDNKFVISEVKVDNVKSLQLIEDNKVEYIQKLNDNKYIIKDENLDTIKTIIFKDEEVIKIDNRTGESEIIATFKEEIIANNIKYHNENILRTSFPTPWRWRNTVTNSTKINTRVNSEIMILLARFSGVPFGASTIFEKTARVIAELVMANKIYFDIVTDYHKREVAPYSYEYRNTIKTYSQDTGRCVGVDLYYSK